MRKPWSVGPWGIQVDRRVVPGACVCVILNSSLLDATSSSQYGFRGFRVSKARLMIQEGNFGGGAVDELVIVGVKGTAQWIKRQSMVLDTILQIGLVPFHAK